MIALQTSYFTVHVDGAGFVVRLQRSGLDYPDLPSMDRDVDAICNVLDRLGRDRKGLCIDWRDGPMRNDTSFEEAVRRVIPHVMRGYRLATIVVRSAVGVLQVKRHLRDANLIIEVFQDEADALEFLRGFGGAMSRRPTPIPSVERAPQFNARGERVATSQLAAVERVSPLASSRSDRHSSLPPLPYERPSNPGMGRDRHSSVPPQPVDRTSQLPAAEDRLSSMPPPPTKGSRS